MAGLGPLVDGCGCAAASSQTPCIGDLSTPEDRLPMVRNAIAEEPEPLVALTHLLRLCRDEHPVLWERMNDVDCRAHIACVHAQVTRALPDPGTQSALQPALRRALAAALAPAEGIPAVVVARALAEVLDTPLRPHLRGRLRRAQPVPAARRGPGSPRWARPAPDH